MPFHEILKQTLFALWETKLRSFLTMFGIVWGITSVILLVGLSIGFNVDQRNIYAASAPISRSSSVEKQERRQGDTLPAATFALRLMTPSQSSSRPR
jgi:ABC-type antimicrobial peptide transport system permease subunit